MAAGDFTWFTQAKVDLMKKLHDLSADTLKLAFITNAVTPTETVAAPHWGGTGTTNYNTNEVTGTGGNYPAEGVTLASVTVAADSADGKFDAADISIAQHASNPTDARWAILYNSTDANKRALGFLDLGSVRDLTSGNFSHAWSANGIMKIV